MTERAYEFQARSAMAMDFLATTEIDCVHVVDAQGILGARVRVTLKDANGVTTTLTN